MMRTMDGRKTWWMSKRAERAIVLLVLAAFGFVMLVQLRIHYKHAKVSNMANDGRSYLLRD
jgi:hypothetical protein